MSKILNQQFDFRPIAFLAGALLLLAMSGSIARAQYEGLTEPFRVVDLASDETGVIEEVMVKEGDLVTAGQIVARLNSEVQQVQLELATHLASSDANVLAAEQLYEKRKKYFEQVSKLREEKFVNDNEVLRAEMEMTIAYSKWKSSQDELIARKIELRRAEAQLKHRNVTVPFDATISRVHRQAGEFVSPIKSEVFTLVDDSKLFAVFNIPSSQIEVFEVGKRMNVHLENGSVVEGMVDFVGSQIDSQSGTILVKILIDNSGRAYRPGEACSLKI